MTTRPYGWFHDAMAVRQYALASSTISYCHYGRMSIAVALSGNLAPQVLDLDTGRIEVLRPHPQTPGGYILRP